jgi:hypothetical protein
MWIRKDAAFEAVVAPELFSRAQEIIQARSKHYTDDEMLDQLRNLFTRYGTLSGVLIDESEGMPSSSAYRSRFSSLARAYTLVLLATCFGPLRRFVLAHPWNVDV